MKSKMNRALVTGAAGQDGYYLRSLLENSGYQVFSAVSEKSLRSSNSVRGGFFMDLANFKDCQEVIDEIRPSHIFHLAAVHGSSGSMKFDKDTRERMKKIHVEATRNLAESLSKTSPAGRLIVAGSSRIFSITGERDREITETSEPNPTDPYGETKLAAWREIIRTRIELGLNAKFLILFNHDSPRRPRQYLTQILARQIAAILQNNSTEIRVRDVHARADWSHAVDIVKAMILAAENPIGTDFVLGSGKARSVQSLIAEQLRHFDLSDVRIVSELNSGNMPTLVSNCSKATQMLEWHQDLSVDIAIRQMVNSWMDVADG